MNMTVRVSPQQCGGAGSLVTLKGADWVSSPATRVPQLLVTDLHPEFQQQLWTGWQTPAAHTFACCCV